MPISYQIKTPMILFSYVFFFSLLLLRKAANNNNKKTSKILINKDFMLLMKKLLIREINEISVPKLFWKFRDAILHTWEVETIK